LRTLCSEEKIVLIFDEVMTGFRLAKGGAQEILNVKPDLSTFGKIIGGGLPVGAYGGKKEIMEMVSPSGSVYQAGTLSGNPLAMAAGYAALSYINTWALRKFIFFTAAGMRGKKPAIPQIKRFYVKQAFYK